MDDGRSVADMSGISGPRLVNRDPARPALRFREVWKTYWNAVKMMLIPMLTVVLALCVIFLVIWLVFHLAY